MTAILIWFGLFLVVFTAFALVQSFDTRSAKSAEAYAIGDGALPGYVFAAAVTAISFAAIAVLVLPSLVFSSGLQTATLALAAIAIPVTGAVFLPRLRAVGKTQGQTDIGHLVASNRSGSLGRSWALIAVLFALPFIAVQLRGTGLVVNLLTDGVVPLSWAMAGLAVLPLLIAAIGGLRGAASVAVATFFTLVIALIVTTGLAVGVIGSLGDLSAAASALDDKASGTSGLTIAAWLVALLGLQASPAILTLALGSRSARGFGAQQVALSALLFGAILIVALPVVVIAAHMLGLDADFIARHGDAARPLLGDWARSESASDAGSLAAVPIVMRRMALVAPWVVSFLGVCALSAMLAAAAAEAAAVGASVARGLARDASSMLSRLSAAALIALALGLAVTPVSIIAMAGFALGAALLILPALLAATYLPRMSGAALIAGQAVGLTVLVSATVLMQPVDPAAAVLPGLLALAANLFAAFLVSALTGDTARAALRREALSAAVSAHRWTGRRTIVFAGIAILIAIGAFGAPVAYVLFGQPGDASTWTLGIPPIMPWLLILWIAGVALIAMLVQKAR